MNSPAIALFAVAVFGMSAVSCRHDRTTASATADPFEGFFAHPSSGAIELHRVSDDGKYTGSMWGDFGPFPVEVRREGNAAQGTVTYGGAAHPLQVESTPKGLILTEDGARAEAPLQRYKDRKAYEEWFNAQGGYQGKIVEVAPTTLPTR